MKIAIAILTWNRMPALKVLLKGVQAHCSSHQLAVFEDAGYRDKTYEAIRREAQFVAYDPEIAAQQWVLGKIDFYLGTENLGVAGNSNRALKWFERIDADYLLLCNDDLEVAGDFALAYCQVAEKTQLGSMCFCGIDSDAYKCQEIQKNGIKLRELTRLTGSMMLISRKALQVVGFFDTIFGKFGEEHCDYSARCRIAGLQDADGPKIAIDIVHENPPLIKQQDIEPTMTGDSRKAASDHARSASANVHYDRDGVFRRFSLFHSPISGLSNCGIPIVGMAGYEIAVRIPEENLD